MSEAKIVLGGYYSAKGAFDATRADLVRLKAQTDAINQSFGSMASVLGSAFAGVSFTAFLRSTINSVDRLNDLKDATGASIENLSALEDVALRTGTSYDTMAASVIKFNQVLKDAKSGDAASNIFAKLGLDAKQLKEIDPAEALRQTAVAFSKFREDGNRARAMQELFGKSTRDVAAFLNDLAKQQKLVATLTTEQGDEAERVSQQFAALSKSSLDLARDLAGKLLPAANNVFAALKQYDGLSGTLVAILGRDSLSRAQQEAEALSGEAARIGDSIQRMSEALSRDPGNDFLAVRIAKARDRLAQVSAAAAQASQRLKDMANAQTKAVVAATAPATDTPKSSIGVIGATDLAAAKKAADERRKLAEFAAQQLVDIEEQAAKDSADAWKYWEKQQLDDYKERTDAAKLQWKQVFEFIDQEQERAIEDGQALLKDLGATGEQVGEQIALALTSAAGEAITHWQGVRGLLKGILQDIAQIALRETVTKPLESSISGGLKGFDFGKLFSGGSAGGTNWGSLLDLFGGSFGGGYFAHGAAFDAAGIRRFAGGDVFGTPTLFRYGGGRTGLMGEAGPEAVMPLKRGADGRLGVAGGGGHTFVFNVAPGATVDDWRRSQRQVSSDLQRSLRRAGAIA